MVPAVKVDYHIQRIVSTSRNLIEQRRALDRPSSNAWKAVKIGIEYNDRNTTINSLQTAYTQTLPAKTLLVDFHDAFMMERRDMQSLSDETTDGLKNITLILEGKVGVNEPLESIDRKRGELRVTEQCLDDPNLTRLMRAGEHMVQQLLLAEVDSLFALGYAILIFQQGTGGGDSANREGFKQLKEGIWNAWQAWNPPLPSVRDWDSGKSYSKELWDAL